MTVRSFAERQSDAEKRDALASMTLTERLLAAILLQLLAMQASRDQAELAAPLKRAGLSTNQIAALLDTTPASLAVAKRRAQQEDKRLQGEP